MAQHAPNIRVEAILIDMARSWERLAIEVEQSLATVAGAAPTVGVRILEGGLSQEAANGANKNSRKDSAVQDVHELRPAPRAGEK
jgi:hypothetical protein